MKFESCIFLAAGTAVSARMVTLPLRSASLEKGGLIPRGLTKLQQRASNISGETVPMTEWYNRTDNQWYITFSVGTPPQNFTALLDTASGDFFIGGNTCTTCGTKNLFNTSLSSTFLNSPGTYMEYLFATGADSIPFTQEQGATGYLIQDTVALGNLKVDNQSFGICNTMGAAINAMPIDGIMGMGPPQSNKSWYWNLVDNGQLKSPLFGFYIPPGNISGAQLTLGGYDDTKFQGDLIWTEASAAYSNLFGAYMVDHPAMYSNGRLVSNSTSAFPIGLANIDTGTAFIQVPDFQTAANIYAQISPNITQIDPAGAWGAPCDELDSVAPDLTFTLGTSTSAVNVTIPKEYFNLGEYPGLTGICQALFNNPSEGIGGPWFYDDRPLWVIGNPLVDKYYTVWDGIGLRIGWGQLANGPGFL